MKKWLASILIVCLLLSLVACGSGGNSDSGDSASKSKVTTEGKTEIEYWMLPLIDEVETQAIVDEFNNQSETTHVNLTMLDWKSGREQIKQAVASGSGPDVFYTGTGLDIAYLEGEVLLPLDEHGYTAEDIGKYRSVIEANMYEDHLYASPLVDDIYVFYSRTDVLEEYGFSSPPKDWDELKSMAKTITEESGGDIMGYQLKGADDQLNALPLSWQSFLAQNGGTMMDVENMKSVMNSPEGIETLEYFKSFYSEGISTMGTSANNGFREGKVAMFSFTTGPLTSEGYVDDPEMEGKWTLSALPAGPKAKGGYLSGHSLAATSYTEDPEKAVEFIKWMTSPQTLATWMTKYYAGHSFDMDKLSNEEKEGIQKVIDSKPEFWEPIIQASEEAKPDFMIQSRYGYTARFDALKRLIIAAITEEVSVEEALEQMDNEINQSL